MAVKFVDHSDVVLRKVGEASEAAIKSTAEMLIEAVQEKIMYGYNDAHGNPPHTEIVDTGRLFDSIDVNFRRSSQNTYSLEIGADTPYAVYVHDGTSKLKGRRFITDAVMDSQEKIEKIMSSVIAKNMK